MSGPFIFIATSRLKEGKLEAERERVPPLVDVIQENEPEYLRSTSTRTTRAPK
jgi:hypothetical protein